MHGWIGVSGGRCPQANFCESRLIFDEHDQNDSLKRRPIEAMDKNVEA
jgi:hypothetical protein